MPQLSRLASSSQCPHVYAVASLACLLFIAVIPAIGQENPPDHSGAEMLSAAVNELRIASFESKLRLRAQILGQEVKGVGTYVQLRGKPETLFRMEIKLDVGGSSSTFEQVCDGRYLWTRRNVPKEKSLVRVDLRRVREALQGDNDMLSKGLPPSPSLPNLFHAGGVPKLLEGLATNFDFPRYVEGNLGQVAIWELAGTWNHEHLLRMFPAQAEAIEAGRPIDTTKLPSHMPDLIVIMLGRDEHIPLFPYRIQFSRRVVPPKSNGIVKLDVRESREGAEANEATPSSEPKFVPMMTLDFYEVRRRPDLEVRQFVFHPGDQEVTDHTDVFLQSLLKLRSAE